MKSTLLMLFLFLSNLFVFLSFAPIVISNPAMESLSQDKINPFSLFRSYFENKGYITGIIEIPELRISVSLKKNQFYRKEEDVKDVYSRINQIRSLFGLSDPYSDASNGNGWCGVLHAECCEQKAFAYIVLIKENLNTASRIYTTGHENGHFLWYVNSQELIYRKFKNPELIKFHIHTNGDFAVLCGWTALKIAGFSLDECMIIYGKNRELEINVERIKKLVQHYLHELN